MDDRGDIVRPGFRGDFATGRENKTASIAKLVQQLRGLAFNALRAAVHEGKRPDVAIKASAEAVSLPPPR